MRGGDEVGTRKAFTTSIDVELQKRFRIACVERSKRMNDVLEALMAQYIEGKEKPE